MQPRAPAEAQRLNIRLLAARRHPTSHRIWPQTAFWSWGSHRLAAMRGKAGPRVEAQQRSKELRSLAGGTQPWEETLLWWGQTPG